MIKRGFLRTIVFYLILIIGIGLQYFHKIYFTEKTQFSLKVINNEYEVVLYNKMGKKVFSEKYPKEPWIKEITKDIIEIGISTGVSSSYIQYFNKDTTEISKIYFNPIFFGDRYIAYMENNELILTDVFDCYEFYKKIKREYSETANPISAIISIEVYDNINIKLRYYSGTNFDENIEIIAIKSK